METLSQISSILNATTNIYLDGISSVAGQTYLELVIFTAGLFLYAVFVWKFYRTVSKRDLFKIDLKKYNLPYVRWRRTKKVGSSILYAFKHIVIFPLYTSFWFALLSVFLFIMAKEMVVSQIIYISIAMIATVRITAYYHEELAGDLAKVLPFSLLAILFTEPSFFSFDVFYSRITQIPSTIPIIVEAFIFTLVLEWALRLMYLIRTEIKQYRSEKDTQSYKYVGNE